MLRSALRSCSPSGVTNPARLKPCANRFLSGLEYSGAVLAVEIATARAVKFLALDVPMVNGRAWFGFWL